MKSAMAKALTCAVLLSGCGGAKSGLASPAPDGGTTASLVAHTTPPAAAAPNGVNPAILADANNAFGLDLWKVLPNPGANFALSPASLATAFGMVEAGARDATLAELRKVLHLDGVTDRDAQAAAGALLARWNATDAPYILMAANRLFGEQTANFLTPFLTIMKDRFGAPLEPVDFAQAPDPSRVRINDWTAAATQQKIKDLIPAGAIDRDTRLVLVNALYFKGRWASRFKLSATYDADFQAPGKVVRVPFMNQTTSVRAGKTDDASLLELPYEGGQVTMTFVMPEGRDLAALEASLSPATLARWNQALEQRDRLQISIPRFTIATDSVPLKAALTKLGLSQAFTPSANFEGMTPEKPLFISDAFHKVFVEVNEEGTEAAAATAVVMTKESASIGFVLDRPFLFLLRDLKTGHILFMGRVTNPAL